MFCPKKLTIPKSKGPYLMNNKTRKRWRHSQVERGEGHTASTDSRCEYTYNIMKKGTIINRLNNKHHEGTL